MLINSTREFFRAIWFGEMSDIGFFALSASVHFLLHSLITIYMKHWR